MGTRGCHRVTVREETNASFDLFDPAAFSFPRAHTGTRMPMRGVGGPAKSDLLLLKDPDDLLDKYLRLKVLIMSNFYINDRLLPQIEINTSTGRDIDAT